jgi:hypothetical protein
MTRLAKNEIYFGSYSPVEKIIEGIDEVKEEVVRSLACDFFNEGSFCLTILGPVDGDGFKQAPLKVDEH